MQNNLWKHVYTSLVGIDTINIETIDEVEDQSTNEAKWGKSEVDENDGRVRTRWFNVCVSPLGRVLFIKVTN